MSTLSLLNQKLGLQDARLITVSDLVQNEDGIWVRTVKFYGDPVVNGAPTLIAEVYCTSATKDDLAIQAPGFKF